MKHKFFKKQLRNYFTLKMRLKRTIGEIRYAANIKELLRPCKGCTIPLSPYGASPNRVHHRYHRFHLVITSLCSVLMLPHSPQISFNHQKRLVHESSVHGLHITDVGKLANFVQFVQSLVK